MVSFKIITFIYLIVAAANKHSIHVCFYSSAAAASYYFPFNFFYSHVCVNLVKRYHKHIQPHRTTTSTKPFPVKITTCAFIRMMIIREGIFQLQFDVSSHPECRQATILIPQYKRTNVISEAYTTLVKIIKKKHAG